MVVVGGCALYYVATEFSHTQSNQRSVVAAESGTALASLSFSFLDRARALPELSFIDGDGRTRTLADFKGSPVLLNIWATWCVPCRKEMPSLDRLQAELGGSHLVVVPLSIDRQGLSVVKAFYAELGLQSLGIFLDQSGGSASKVNAVGLPTTLFIDPSGREIGRKIGPAEWDSPETVALVRERLKLGSSAKMDDQ
ncbi:MAG: hypothetical protein BGO51_16975 [Rhodospirillales bacterium 69-11]|nr:MAG: hypothetical protein BGO51_16975 [Rhodospirillales bacterium 69-11]